MQHGALAGACLPLLLLLVAAGVVTGSEHGRKLMIRDLVDPSQRCRNTFNGPFNLTDDKGTLCSRNNLDYRTGCCNTGTQNDCSACTMYDECCTHYEACVSCCLHPKNHPLARAKERFKAEKHEAAGHWNDAFEFCRGVCRTSGKSTSHENAYISPRHHCYSQHGKPFTTGPFPKGAFDKALLAIGDPGENCDAVCTKWGAKGCSLQYLKELNNCDRLREWASCEAGCEGSSSVTGPAYVDPNAPKQDRPAMCFFLSEPEKLSCSTAADQHRRLCGCDKKE